MGRMVQYGEAPRRPRPEDTDRRILREDATAGCPNGPVRAMERHSGGIILDMRNNFRIQQSRRNTAKDTNGGGRGEKNGQRACLTKLKFQTSVREWPKA